MRSRELLSRLVAIIALITAAAPAGAQFPTPAQQRPVPTPSQEPQTRGRFSDGCSLAMGAGLALGNIQIWSGIPAIDAAYQQEGLVLIQTFGVTPAGGFLRDMSGPNAYATAERMFQNGPDGTILFGLTLMSQELQRDGGVGISIPAIMAHEFAHILQFKNGQLEGHPTVVRELHADFMAGWYMARRSQYIPIHVEPALRSFFEKGDYEFNSADHHGTPDQRVRAFMAGMQSASLNVRQAFSQGLEVVLGDDQ